MRKSAPPSGIAFVVSGPSGAGKTTLLRKVLESDPGLRFSVSHTTRAPRAGEENGVDYFFVSREEFKKLIEADAFLEHAEYQGNLYGTSRLAVEEMLASGVDVVLEVEVKGARHLREQLPDAVSVIVLPPSMDALIKRLRLRASDSEAAIQKRYEIARGEVREASGYSYVIVNSNLETAVQDMQHIIHVARLRPERVLPAWWSGESE